MRVSIAVIGAIAMLAPANAAFVCSTLKATPNVLSMAASQQCRNSMSPSVYYAKASDCHGVDGSVECIQGTGGCAIACLSPFSGGNNASWNLVLTNSNEDATFKQNTSFRGARIAAADVHNISNLEFSKTTQSISISANALTVVHSETHTAAIAAANVMNEVAIDFSFLANASNVSDIAIENINLTTLTSLPKLPKLESLSLANGAMTTLPEGIDALSALRTLDLTRNSLAHLENASLPASLVNLSLADTGVAAVPATVIKMTQLQTLNLSMNNMESLKVSAIPSTVQTLDLSLNALSDGAVAADWTAFRNLTHLYLHGNHLTMIPSSIFSLSHLQELTIQNNSAMIAAGKKIRFDDAQLAFLAQLKTFTIDQKALDTECGEAKKIANSAYTVCGTNDKTAPNHHKKTVIIVNASVVATLLVVVLVVLLILHRKRVQRSTWKRGNMADDLLSNSDGYTESALESSMTTDVSDTHSIDIFGLARRKNKYRIHKDLELRQLRVEKSEVTDLEVLSTGRTNTVYLALYQSDYVAVKRLTEKTSTDSDSEASDTGSMMMDRVVKLQRPTAQSFAQEIKFHARLVHPNIVKLVGAAWTKESDLEAVFEYMVNRDLFTYISNLDLMGGAAVRQKEGPAHHWNAFSLRVAIDIADGVNYLHTMDAQTLHGNLTSKHVLLDESLSAKLTGFNAAESQGSTDCESIVGRALWTAPEIISGASKCSRKADIYALGVILSELDTRCGPFDDADELSEPDLLSRICSGELEPSFQANSPPEIVALAKRCLSLDPMLRPSAQQVLEELKVCYNAYLEEYESANAAVSIGAYAQTSSTTSTSRVTTKTTRVVVADTISTTVYSEGGFNKHCRHVVSEKEGSMRFDHTHTHE